jgi:hypothetical protein
LELEMSILLPPVPPITEEGFKDPVWPKWLSKLHTVVTSSITIVGDATGTGSDVVNVTLTNSPQTRKNLGLGSISTQSSSSVLITGGTISNSNIASSAISNSTVAGTILGDSAATGIVGEYIEITGSSTNIPQNTATNIVTLALSAGDWDVQGIVQVSAISTITSGCSLSATGIGKLGSYVIWGPSAQTFSVPVIRVSLSTASNIYLPVTAMYSGTACTATGYMRARRMR